MRCRRSSAAIAVAIAMMAAACTSVKTLPSPSASASNSRAPVPSGKGSAATAMKALCIAPRGGGRHVRPTGRTPATIATVEHQVEAVRGLTYKRSVAVDPITQGQMDAKISRSFAVSYPARFWGRRSKAWQTVGVIPAGTSIRGALLKFLTGQVVGFYNPDTGELVYIGTPHLDTQARFTLAHELTHAIDDQHFNLRRTEPLSAACRDEDQLASLGAIEGSAQFFATQVLLRFPEDLPSGGGGGGSLAGVPPFMTALEAWPYITGQAFITALESRGGLAAVNDALRHLPISTEQVMHPSHYPGDVPVQLDISDLGPKLGQGWQDLDVQQVGEEWLRAMLTLRLNVGTAVEAAAGWGGGLYRAWSNGAGTAVVLKTAWDTTQDATQFADAVQSWLAKGGGEQAFVSRPDPFTVQVGFASDAPTLTRLKEALR